MKINIKTVNMALARKCVSSSYFRKFGIAPQTIARAMKGEELTPRTVGKIAKALETDVSEIVAVDS